MILKTIVNVIRKIHDFYTTRKFQRRNWNKELGIPKDWEKIPTKKGEGFKFRAPSYSTDMVTANNNILDYESRCSCMKYKLEIIQNISDLDYQRRLWIEGSIPNSMGSWEDTMNDFDIDDFLKDLTPESHPEFDLSQVQIDALWKLRDRVDYYCSVTPKYMNPHNVLADPRWHEVAACAQVTLKAFADYEVPRDDELKV